MTTRLPLSARIAEWDEQDLKDYTLGLLTVTLFGGLLLWVRRALRMSCTWQVPCTHRVALHACVLVVR